MCYKDLPYSARHIFDPTVTVAGLIVTANQLDTPKTKKEQKVPHVHV